VRKGTDNEDHDEDEDEDSFDQQIYKKFLIGSKACQYLRLNTYKQLKFLAKLALNHHQSLQQLREVEIDRSYIYVPYYDRVDDQPELAVYVDFDAHFKVNNLQGLP
jgi:hypothetical protein